MGAAGTAGVERIGRYHPMGVGVQSLASLERVDPMGVAPASGVAGAGVGEGQWLSGGDGAPKEGRPPARTAPGRVIIEVGGATVLTGPPARVVSIPPRRSSGRVGKTAIVPPARTQPTSASSSAPSRRASRSDGRTTTVAAAYPAG